MKFSELANLYSETNRARFLAVAFVLVIMISFADWVILPEVDLGFLYIFPILLAAGFLARWQVVAIGLICVTLREAFGPYPTNLASVSVFRMVRGMTDFVAAGIFVRELARNRQIAINHLKKIEEEIRLREDVERELQVLVDSSPAAILIVDSQHKVSLSNSAAHRMLALENGRLEGKLIDQFLPVLGSIQERSREADFLHTEMESTGRRNNGEIFRAHIWLSTYPGGSGSRLAAIVVDSSEELRDREESGLSRLLSNSRVLMGTVAHETRNLCGAIAVAHANLTRLPSLGENEDFRALGNLLEALRKLASAELRPLAKTQLASVSLGPILDDLRIVIQPSYRELGAAVVWNLADPLPLVWADPQGLLQVFLNITQNSQRAILHARTKALTISTSVQIESVIVKFVDTGSGVCHPEHLFQPFQQGSDVVGLGLYVSRAIMRSFGGDLRYERRDQGACFAVELVRADEEAQKL